MVGSRRWLVVATVAVLAGLALLGVAGPGHHHHGHGDGDGGGVTVRIAEIVEATAPTITAAADTARGLARSARPVPLPSRDEEALRTLAATAALVLGWWVLVRGDGWGARPVVASPLAARRGPPA